MESQTEKARERLKRDIGLALSSLQNDLDWIVGGNLNVLTGVDIHIRYSPNAGAEVTVTHEIWPYFKEQLETE